MVSTDAEGIEASASSGGPPEFINMSTMPYVHQILERMWEVSRFLNGLFCFLKPFLFLVGRPETSIRFEMARAQY